MNFPIFFIALHVDLYISFFFRFDELEEDISDEELSDSDVHDNSKITEDITGDDSLDLEKKKD